KALVSSLCREVALIEGPPGTGKSYIGVGIMRALLAPENRKTTKIGPILTICYTNHALDNFLEDNIVRIGSRSKSEVISQFSLEEKCRNLKVTNRWLIRQTYQDLDSIINEASTINTQLTNRTLNLNQESVSNYFRENYHFVHLENPNIPPFLLNDNDDNELEWRKANGKKKTRRRSVIEQWVNGDDLTAAQKFKESLINPQESEEAQFKNWIQTWQMPTTKRSLEVLKHGCDVWGMSKDERVRLHDFWREEINFKTNEKLLDIQKRYVKKKKDLENIYDDGRRQVLLNSDVIGMTTTGAAKYHDLIKKIGPKIIICEEAGEVLEAHILASLTKSAQHLILIGDHNQLRPKIRNDYKLDISLFERLVHGEQSMRLERTQLLTQRRMRKEISDLVRQTLYPKLEDNPITEKYPKVKGIQHNVYFMHHINPEDSTRNEFAIQSHSNRFEVEMIVEMYFVRNGYTKPEQIAVLTPYLGQMLKIKEALSKSFAVVIDERDSEQLTDLEEDGDTDQVDLSHDTISVASRKRLNQQVILRTIDNFQGEEADTVIISLVRNITENSRNTIGFLKTKNRTNVLLSRARHGMYLMGNAELMEKESGMWKDVISILRSRNQVGPGFPIVCDQHPETKNIITYPEKFKETSPDGGCLLPCGKTLNCGHRCPHKCHPDDPNHISIFCSKPCTKLHKCLHPCKRMCGEDCGECIFPVGDLLLPCGHILKDAKCFQKSTRDKINCRIMVNKMLPNCEHSVTVECYISVYDISCQSICGLFNPDCHHDCQEISTHANGGRGRTLKLDNNVHIARTHHEKCKQICEKILFCGHSCEESCHLNKDCPGCKKECNVNCKHSVCNKPCSHPCSVCAEECDWYCEHKGACGVSCGVPCNRLPCNERCSKLLSCGHQCMGICGEKCPSQKYCTICAPDDIKDSIVDLITQTRFAEVDWTTERMIVLECGHVFTADTLDNMMEMKSLYHMDDAMENWIGIKQITDQPRKFKTCPNCRAPIKNIRRYGRIIKKCVLDVQNKKFLLEYNRQLKIIQVEFGNIIENLENNRGKVLEKYGKLKLPNAKQKKNNDSYKIDKIDKIINRAVPVIVPSKKYEMLKNYYSIPTYHEKLWRKHVSPLLLNYRQVALIISNSTNPPYKLVYESAVTSLFAAKSKEKVNMDNLLNNISSLQISDDSPAVQQSKFQETLKEVGISISKVD
ncbi:6792_t:CDS:10, partial [Diversispora eburnea]